MKNLNIKYVVAFLTAALIFQGTSLFAQSGVTEFEVDGLKVIYKKSPKDVISARFVVRGGTANYTKSKEGIEAMAFHMASAGPEGMTTVDFSSQLGKIGAEISNATTYDYGHLSLSCIKPFWDESWDLFTSAIMNPAFNAEDFAIEQEKLVAAAKQNAANPDAHLRNLAASAAYEGKPYSNVPSGTAESLASFSLEDVKTYWAETIGKKRAFLVIVGNVSEEDVKAKVKSTLATLKEGTPAKVVSQHIIKEGKVKVEDREIETNYIRGLMSAPRMGTEDYAAMRVAMGILGDIYFEELRTKRSLTYAPGAFYAAGVLGSPYNGLYISTQKPVEAVEVMVMIIDSIKTNGFGEKKLKDKKGTFLTYHYLRQETSSAQSQSVAEAEIAGDWKFMETFNDDVTKVTYSQLNKVFDKYTNAISWAYLGKQIDIKPEQFKQTKTATKVNKPY